MLFFLQEIEAPDEPLSVTLDGYYEEDGKIILVCKLEDSEE